MSGGKCFHATSKLQRRFAVFTRLRSRNGARSSKPPGSTRNELIGSSLASAGSGQFGAAMPDSSDVRGYVVVYGVAVAISIADCLRAIRAANIRRSEVEK